MEDAEEAYLIALELESNHGLAYLGLGRVQSKLGRVKEALKSVEKSIGLMNEDYRPYMVRGDIYFGLGDYERADSKGYSKAVNIVITQQKVSTSFIQRYLQIGYNRAARMVEKMEEEGIISEANNAGKRHVLKKN